MNRSILHYQSAGNSGSGTPIVILHGLFGSSDNWSRIAKQLSVTRQVITVDLRNHGQSPHHAVMDYAVMAADIIALLVDLKLTVVDLIGHSIGGKVAMAVSQQAPERLRKLVVVDIAPRQYEDTHRQLIDTLLAIDLTQYTSRRAVDEALATAIPDKAVRQFLLMNLQADAGQLSWQINVAALSGNYTNLGNTSINAEQITLPTCFIRGGASGYISAQDEVKIKQQFTQCIVATIPDAGHWVHAAAPTEFLQIIGAFLT